MGTFNEDSIALSLFPQVRSAVLSLLFLNSEMDYHFREIVRVVDSGIGAVQRELKNLTEAGIVVRERHGNQVHYKANKACPVFDDLKSIIIKTWGLADIIRQLLSPLKDRIEFAFIYGSFASGEATYNSDVDIMIIGDTGLRDVIKLIPQIHGKMDREINPVVYSASEFIERKKSGNSFILNVLRSPKIMLFGEENEPGLLG